MLNLIALKVETHSVNELIGLAFAQLPPETASLPDRPDLASLTMKRDAVEPTLPVPNLPRRESGRATLSEPGAWVDLYGDYLFRYALIRVRNETVAEDLVQDALLAAFEGRERFTGQSPERSWLTGILKHKILDHFRDQARERTVVLDEALPPELEGRFDELGLWKHEPATGPADWGADAGSQMQREEFMAALAKCLARLPARCADAFVLRELEAVDSDQIQQTLGISPSNFWVLLHRARMQLRLCLEQNWLRL